jgi:hypothetical protein
MPDRGSFGLLIAAVISSVAAFYLGLAPSQPAPARQSSTETAPDSSTRSQSQRQGNMEAARVELPVPPPTTVVPGKYGDYSIGIFLRKGNSDKDVKVRVMAEWTGVSSISTRRARFITQNKPSDWLSLEPGDLKGTILNLGKALPDPEKGYLRFISCIAGAGEADWTPATASRKPTDCARIDHAVELAAAPAAPKVVVPDRPEPFQVPVILTLITTAIGLIVLLWPNGPSITYPVSDLNWKIDESFAANLNVGTTIVTSLSAIGISFDGSEYSKTEFVTWTAFYALFTALAPIVFGLLKKPGTGGKPNGSLAGFTAATLLNLFGVFGQLFMALVLLKLLPDAKLIEAESARYLQWLPVALMVSVMWYAAVSFVSIRKATTAAAPAPIRLAAL